MSIFRFARRTPTTLADLARQYLNQALPDISGIFKSPQASNIITPVVEEEAVAAPGLTPEQLRLLYGEQSGGGSDEFRGGGKFGNLDLTRSKTVVRDVYDEELGDFIPTELTAYYNPTIGNFQTFEGKNINPAFTNIPIGVLGTGLNFFGLRPPTIGGYTSGKIRGIYDTPMDFIRGNRNDPPGMTPAQITKRKKGIESLSETYRDIGQSRDRDDGPQNISTSGGNIGDRVSSSYREDPETGLL
tara:strand:+ start:751 stop:1482 length:732 start_codon:yes stop_codon:yes gene_type:complete